MLRQRLLFVFFILFFTLWDIIGKSEENVNTEEISSNPFSQAKFVPDISLILDGSLKGSTKKDIVFSTLKLPENITGQLEKTEFNNGFNFNYAELVLSSTVDPYFDLNGVFEFQESAAGIEEGYLTTRSLPFGFKLKAGKFLSQFSRINSQHEHIRNFNELPLVYQLFFGKEGLNETGLALDYIFPMDMFMEAGIELLQGNNNLSFGRNQMDGFSTPQYPGVLTGFIKNSFDLNYSELLLQLSGCAGDVNATTDTAETNVPFLITGKSYLANITTLLKIPFDSVRMLSFQAEGVIRYNHGNYYYLNPDESNLSKKDFSKVQDGFYSEISFRSDKKLLSSFRYDLLTQNRIMINKINQNYPDLLARYSAVFDYNFSEFSRFRLEYQFDRSMILPDSMNKKFLLQPVHNLELSFNISIGAHGAHEF